MDDGGAGERGGEGAEGTRGPAPIGGLARWMQLADRPGFRWTITAVVGFAFFALGVAYLNLGQLPDVVSFKVVGGEVVQAGHEAVVRVSARFTDARKGVPVSLREVTLDGAPAHLTIAGDQPASLSLSVPSEARGEITLGMKVQAADRLEALAVTFPVVPGGDTDLRLEPVGKLPEIRTAHRIELRPEGGALAMHMDNRVLVRILDLDGRPVTGAEVEVRHKSLSEGAVRGFTDASGLWAFPMDAKQPSFRVGVKVESGQGEDRKVTRTDRILRPFGRQMQLSMVPAVTPPGTEPRPRLATWRPDTDVWCDLVSSGAWVWSAHVTSLRDPMGLALPALEEGLHQLQCYDHPWAPDEAHATLPILVASGDPLEALLQEVRSRRLTWPPAAIAPEGTDPALAAAWWVDILRGPLEPPQLLVSTRQTDLAARAKSHKDAKQELLLWMAGVFFVVLLWLTDTVLKSMLDKRDRMRAYAIELAMEGHDPSLGPEDNPHVIGPADLDAVMVAGYQQRQNLVKLRSVALVVAVFGAIVGGVVGFLGLLHLIR